MFGLDFPRYTTQWIYVVTGLGILAALWVGVSQGYLGAGFDEGQLGTHISVLILLLTGLTALAIYRGRGGAEALPLFDNRRIWQICGIGFIFLSLDDAFRIHENLDKLIHLVAGLEETGLSDRIDDVLILFYGLIGVGFLWRARDEILQSRWFVTFMAAGFVLMLVQFVVDAGTNSPDLLIWLGVSDDQLPAMLSWAIVVEESAKILAGATLLAGFVHAYRELVLHDRVSAPGSLGPRASGH